MKPVLYICMVTGMFGFCQSKAADRVSKKDGIDLAGPTTTFDTLIKPFADKSYQFAIHMDSLGGQTATMNSTLTFKRVQDGKDVVIFKDKAFCGFPIVEMRDMDNDGVDDILIYGEIAGRGGNEYYHLYLVDKLQRKLISVKGFDHVVTPQLDRKTNIISSLALAGKNYYSFYRINKQHQLINLGHGFEDDPQNPDDDRYAKAIKAIVKQHGK